MASRRLASVTRRTSLPSIRTAPAVASCSRGISASAVDLPAAGRADQRDRRAGLRLEAQAGEADAAVRIDEMHVVEHDVAAPRRQRRRIRRVHDARPLVDHGEHAHQAGQPLLQRGVQRAERAQWP